MSIQIVCVPINVCPPTSRAHGDLAAALNVLHAFMELRLKDGPEQRDDRIRCKTRQPHLELVVQHLALHEELSCLELVFSSEPLQFKPLSLRVLRHSILHQVQKRSHTCEARGRGDGRSIQVDRLGYPDHGRRSTVRTCSQSSAAVARRKLAPFSFAPFVPHLPRRPYQPLLEIRMTSRRSASCLAALADPRRDAGRAPEAGRVDPAEGRGPWRGPPRRESRGQSGGPRCPGERPNAL